MTWEIRFSPRAKRELAQLPKRDMNRVDNRIQALQEEPHPANCQKLSGFENLYRIRAGDYRIIYQIIDDEIVVVVIRIGHRKDVYRLLREP